MTLNEVTNYIVGLKKKEWLKIQQKYICHQQNYLQFFCIADGIIGTQTYNTNSNAKNCNVKVISTHIGV